MTYLLVEVPIQTICKTHYQTLARNVVGRWQIMFSIVICLDHLPEMKLSTNGRGNLHFIERNKLVTAAKDEAYYISKNALSKCDYWQVPNKARISYEFYTNDRRVKDLDNLISATKATVDGLVLAGVISSDSGWNLSIGKAELIFASQKQTRLIIEAMED